MPQFHTSQLRLNAWALGAGLALLLAFAVACGGDDGGFDDGTISESEAKATADRYLATTLGLFTGNADPDDFVGMFAPACREGVDTSALTFIVMLIQGFAPELADLDIEAVDVGDVTVTQTAEGTLVVPVDPNAVRVRINGNFMPASEVFGELGFDETEDSVAEPILLVKEGGRVYIGECALLDELSEGFGMAPAGTPAIRV